MTTEHHALTEREFAICRAVGAKWVSMDPAEPESRAEYAELWEEKPDIVEGGVFYRGYWGDEGLVASVAANRFPSVRPGECVEAGEAAPSEPPDPCDACAYSPPSSGDGKPCTMCPAVGRDS